MEVTDRVLDLVDARSLRLVGRLPDVPVVGLLRVPSPNLLLLGVELLARDDVDELERDGLSVELDREVRHVARDRTDGEAFLDLGRLAQVRHVEARVDDELLGAILGAAHELHRDVLRGHLDLEARELTARLHSRSVHARLGTNVGARGSRSEEGKAERQGGDATSVHGGSSCPVSLRRDGSPRSVAVPPWRSTRQNGLAAWPISRGSDTDSTSNATSGSCPSAALTRTEAGRTLPALGHLASRSLM